MARRPHWRLVETWLMPGAEMKVTPRAIALAMMLAVLTPALSQPQGSAVDQHVQAKGADHDQGPRQPVSPSPPVPDGPPENKEERQNYAQEKAEGNPSIKTPFSWGDFWGRVIGEPMNLFTLALTVATIVIMGETWRMRRIAARQADELKDSLRIAQESADAAKLTAGVLQESAINDLRAYVHVTNAQATRDEEGVLWASVTVKNTGKTPAYDMRQWCGIGFNIHGSQPYPFSDLPPDTLLACSVIGPGAHTNLVVPTISTIRHIESRIAEGLATVHLHGMITYTDIFKQARYTKFRLFMGEEGTRNGQFQHATEGNEAT